jgi:hypothetical protein
MSASDPGKPDRIVAEARRAAEKCERSYREQALQIYPWICGRCAREFTRASWKQAQAEPPPPASARPTDAPFADLKERLAKK